MGGGLMVRSVDICSLCGWIDFAALDGWAENAIKLSLAKRAQAAGVASGTRPFAFVVLGDAADLSLDDLLVQAFTAVSEIPRNEDGTPERGRATEIYHKLRAEIQRMIRIAVANEVACVKPLPE
jgi:hypothetical protein